jgi:hypothetical protein
MAGFFEKRRQERAEKEAMMELVKKAREERDIRFYDKMCQRRAYLAAVVFTPQNLADYARLIRTPLEMIDLPSSDKGVLFSVNYNSEYLEQLETRVEKSSISEMHYEDFLVQSEIFAIVDARPISESRYYGIPVRRKK